MTTVGSRGRPLGRPCVRSSGRTPATRSSATTVQEPSARSSRRLPHLPLVVVMAGGIALNVAIAFTLRSVARATLDVPADLASLRPAALLPAAAMPVLGGSFGWSMSFRRHPGPASLRVFLIMSGLFTVLGTALGCVALPSSATATAIVSTIVINVIANVVAVGLLLGVLDRVPAELVAAV